MWGSIFMSIPIFVLIMFICCAEMYMVVVATPCYFVFGDSLSDSGNNNQQPTKAKANYYPYGVDYDGSVSTGRFTNGYTLIDILTNLSEISTPLPTYSSISDVTQASTLINGVNYASGGAGIHPESGSQLLIGETIVTNLATQVKHHTNIVSKLGLGSQGQEKTLQYLGECVYVMFIGSNDYVNNYFGAPANYFITSKAYSTDEYAKILINLYSKQIQNLYDLGARKFAPFFLPLATGCAPAEILLFGRTFASFCNNGVSAAVKIFNDKLQSLVNDLKENLINSTFVIVDLNLVLLTPFQGFTQFTKSCCMVTRSFGQCDRGIDPCEDRDSYIFWDNFHPTQAVNVLFGKAAYNQIFPMLS